LEQKTQKPQKNQKKPKKTEKIENERKNSEKGKHCPQERHGYRRIVQKERQRNFVVL
jgi:hypothetical protein